MPPGETGCPPNSEPRGGSPAVAGPEARSQARQARPGYGGCPRRPAWLATALTAWLAGLPALRPGTRRNAIAPAAPSPLARSAPATPAPGCSAPRCSPARARSGCGCGLRPATRPAGIRLPSPASAARSSVAPRVPKRSVPRTPAPVGRSCPRAPRAVASAG